jgi:hypothetical protein
MSQTLYAEPLVRGNEIGHGRGITKGVAKKAAAIQALQHLRDLRLTLPWHCTSTHRTKGIFIALLLVIVFSV